MAKVDKNDLTKYDWNSLNQLKDYLERHLPKEKVVSFDGIHLITEKNLYGLGPNGLRIQPISKKKVASPRKKK